MVNAVLEDYRTAPISDREKALFAFIERMNRESYSLLQEDLDQVKATGWSEEALYDAITVCALFNFYNKWIDATGVADMPPEAYAASGERMAAHGYGSPKPPSQHGSPPSLP
ncbi:MAG: peroxidase [Gemmatimonadaceae bacterium]